MPRKPKILYRLEVTQDPSDFHGNASAVDEETDKAVETEIERRLDQGDLWAWADVKVTAECEGFQGCDYLGGCNYKDEAEFKFGGYYEDMKKAALDDLKARLKTVRNDGQRAAKLLRDIRCNGRQAKKLLTRLGRN
jgi:hypothetical protein